MVKVRMTRQMTGTRDGQDWPAPGETIDVDASEARQLVANGVAEDPKGGGKAETAEASPAGESKKRPAKSKKS